MDQQQLGATGSHEVMSRRQKITLFSAIVLIAFVLGGIMALGPQIADQQGAVTKAPAANTPKNYTILAQTGDIYYSCASNKGGESFMMNMGNYSDSHFWMGKEYLCTPLAAAMVEGVGVVPIMPTAASLMRNFQSIKNISAPSVSSRQYNYQCTDGSIHQHFHEPPPTAPQVIYVGGMRCDQLY